MNLTATSIGTYTLNIEAATYAKRNRNDMGQHSSTQLGHWRGPCRIVPNKAL